jgi:hypothetical protein
MNWDAIGAVGELIGAAAVVLTLGYLAVQVKHAKAATADQSRIYRADAVRDIILETCRDDSLRLLQTKNWGLEPFYRELADELGLTLEEATKLDWGNCYYFWMWWGQFASTTEEKDQKELQNVVANLGGTPGLKSHWHRSPLSRTLLDKEFVGFIDEILGAPAKSQ